MEERAIPPLNKPADLQTSLLHVTIIIRHGARTPWNDHTCWTGWKEQDWNCELKTLTAPPSQPEILLLEKNTTENVELNGEGAMFLFEKNYDALMDPPQLRNTFKGNCQKGQLLMRGYVQELHNGKMLRDTYVKEQNSANSEGGTDDLVLIDLNEGGDLRPYEEPNLYYRADDDQRTIMSGQVLLRGLFGDLIQQHSKELGTQVDPTIVLHTADKNRDILSMNPDVCPRLNDLWDEAEKSLEYAKKFVNNRESQELNELMESLGGDFRDQAEDCLMTAICNDRDLPEALDDFGQGHANNYFDRLDKYSFKPFNFILRYNNAAYSKLAFGPMWVNILSNVLAYIPTSTWHNILPNLISEVRSPSPTLALFSAHDTTILSILATLGENVWDGQTWAPYASMIVMEIHKVGTGDERRFRLVYNGQILTDKVQGCAQDEELCDVKNLLTTVKDFAVKKRNCESNLSSSDELDTLALKQMIFTSKGTAIIFLFTMLSGAVGGLVTYVFLTHRLPCRRIDGKGEFSKAPISAPRADDGIAITGVPDYGLGSMLDENIIL
jgi:ubiquitin-like domain-containing CTD phosphatase 1